MSHLRLSSLRLAGSQQADSKILTVGIEQFLGARFAHRADTALADMQVFDLAGAAQFDGFGSSTGSGTG